MAEISILKYGGGIRITDAEAKDIRLLLLYVPLLLEIPLHNLPSDVRPGHRLEVWSYDEGRGKGCHHFSRTFNNVRVFRLVTRMPFHGYLFYTIVVI